ncbi:MAG: class II fructose-bisphosphate aldolase [Sphaerochaetaceae bacterium]|jgi:fructose-bisphosphate aldolase class II|nr:class II fructose-bisphosphate aldolase [Sphaerochaetaceae bacterium]NLV83708.1 class II fructose-bisphosphate aldolase [Spirochaetales bacterium]
MAIEQLDSLIQKAYREQYALPAFNFWTFEDAETIIKTAARLQSPVVVMLSASGAQHLGYRVAHAIVDELADVYEIPVVLHLDHCESVTECYKAMRHGFSSVMYDGSGLDVEANISNTLRVLDVARSLDCSVEAEIGRIGRGEEGQDIAQVITQPAAAQYFYEKTGVDALAIAVGTVHGMQTQQAEIRFDVVEKISELVKVPLVLHGSSGVRDEDFNRLVKTGISKINIGTKLRDTFVASCREKLIADSTLRNHLKLFSSVSEKVAAVVAEKIRLLGAQNKAFSIKID